MVLVKESLERVPKLPSPSLYAGGHNGDPHDGGRRVAARLKIFFLPYNNTANREGNGKVLRR